MPTDFTNSQSPLEPQAASIADHIRNFPQYLYPQRLISRWVYRLTRIRTPWFKNGLIRIFIRLFRVDMTEAAQSDPGYYTHFNHFFTRPLRAGIRPIASGDKIVSCPVDGRVSQAGTIEDDELFQAKSRSFSLIQLLGGEGDYSPLFRGGHFMTLYLAPRDYHRIHMPLTGKLREMVHIPGKLFSVSPLTTRVIQGLFSRNERVAAFFDTAAGPMAMVLVGAINVSSIETVWAGVITPPYGKRIRRWEYPETGPEVITLDKGTEIGRFNMGSTVIVLFGRNAVDWDNAIHPDAKVRMGQRLGEIVSHPL